MADPRPTSLLHFAIAASIGVVPVLLVVLLGIGKLAPTDRKESGATHVSVRQVAALKSFEHAIVRRDTVRSVPASAAALIALVPECSTEWRGRERALDRVGDLVGLARDPARMPAHRIAAHLLELDEALMRLSAGENRRVADPVGFDLERWAVAARGAIATPVETPRYPGRRFGVRCADLASAAAMLARGGGRMLTTLAWRGTAVDRAIAGWRPDQQVEIAERQLARTNPWDGLPGCIYLLNGDGDEKAPAYFIRSARGANERVCNQAAVFDDSGRGDAVAPLAIAGEPAPDLAADDARWHVPPSIHALLQPLEPLRRTSGASYRTYTQTGPRSEASTGTVRQRPNQVMLDGVQVDVGFSLDLTIDPGLQALAQKTAACYTGRQDVCSVLGIARAEDGTKPIGHRLLEGAMVRMAAIAIIDVHSGRIEALAGALSPCTRQEYDGPGRASNCDKRLPYPIRYRPDTLLNPAVHIDAMPASLVKPVMATAFLSNASVGSRWLAAERAAMRSPSLPARESLRGQLMRSDSARFLDRMFCGDEAFRPCQRPWEIQAAAAAFGWNSDCTAPSERCGKRDLLFGRAADDSRETARDAVAAWIPYGRLLVEPVSATLGAPFRARSPVALDLARVKRCAAGADGRRASDDDWEKCRGGTVVDVVAEGWGQGHARSTALGAAGMMAALAAAANGQEEVRKPHLIRALRGVASNTSTLQSDARRWAAAATERNSLSRDAAEVVLSGLSYSHRSGTARRACEQVFDARACREIDWIAGKTGTPTFPNDERSLDELARLCMPGVDRTRSEQTACGGLRPYKWYVAAYKTERSSPSWSKVIGVLVERNWLVDGGRVHGAGDHGPNPAAELAFQIVGRHTRALTTDAR